jgi:hypothetical protein
MSAEGKSINISNISTSMSPSKHKRGLRFHSAFRILESPNHRATVETNLYRIPDGSKAVSPYSRDLEIRWDNRFNVTFSKDNNMVYTANREYFDSPRKFGQGIPKRNNGSPSSKQRQARTRASKYDQEKESMWSTRYSASSEWNEVKHKKLRNYFEHSLN